MSIERTNIVELPMRDSEDRGDGRSLRGAVRDALALMEAISQGALLEGPPEDEADFQRFQTGISLLEMAEDILRRAVGKAQHG
jgi:hypothetical protein